MRTALMSAKPGDGVKLPPLILASASPRRSELLRQLSTEFQIVPGAAREVHDDQLTAWEMAQVNAYRKARAVAKKFPDALVLAADTLVYLDQEAKLFALRACVCCVCANTASGFSPYGRT